MLAEVISTIIKVIFFIFIIISATKIGIFLKDKKNSETDIRKYIIIIFISILLILILSIIFIFK